MVPYLLEAEETFEDVDYTAKITSANIPEKITFWEWWSDLVTPPSRRNIGQEMSDAVKKMQDPHNRL